MLRYEIINALAKRIGATRYLEIGVQDGVTFRSVRVPRKVGVDPDTRTPATFHMTSDRFFGSLFSSDSGFDLVFVDGLHQAAQVERDINNAIRHLRPGGAVVVHDCSPPNREYTHPDRCGDTYLGWIRTRAQHPEQYFATVDADLGCGVILPARDAILNGWAPTPVPPPAGEPADFAAFHAERERWLNLISVSEFLTLLDEGPGHPRPEEP